MTDAIPIPFDPGEIVFDADGNRYEVAGRYVHQIGLATFHRTGLVYDLSDPLVYAGSFSRIDPLGRPVEEES
jgi:hypothetical protein